MSRDLKYLKQKNGTWYFQIHVPKKLKAHPKFIGKTVYTESLKTKDLRTAKARRDKRLEEIEALREGSTAVDFRAQTEAFRKHSKEFLEQNPHLEGTGVDFFSVYLDELEAEARKQYGISLESPDLPYHLKVQLDALMHSQRIEKDPDLPPPDEYQSTLKDMLKKTLDNKRQQGKGDKTLGKIERSVDVFLEHHEINDIPITKIRRKHAVEFCQAAQQQWSGSTVSNFMVFLGQVWKTARDLEIVSGENPFADHHIKSDGQEVKPWTPEQIKDLYELLSRSESKHADEDRLLFKIGLYTGARLEEIHSLTEKNLVYRPGENDEQILSFHIKPHGDGKTRSSTRYVPVHPALFDDLKGFKGFSGTADAAGKRFGRLKKAYLGAANSRSLVFHSLRHYVSTELYRAGYDSYFVRFLTGHARSSSGGTELERTYIHGPSYQVLADAIAGLKKII
ncbi:tyrosine-type recombinase/integrase [Guyparkeria halophila]|uniref:Tyrosine-type recombinase/integrase n=1 Tax=Guyparkeria halophila TaxID=47960 RepID=A0A6I6CXJ8_9GAMM|nr:tyrosine-type recombinase/integrase [Guyparkeria halophila]QGT78909.1 tyrosine-type recombinase/integrase [Guyparkeria halophila]